MSKNTKSTPAVAEKTVAAEATVRISARTGKPVRQYRKTGASALRKSGISPRTGKAIRKYEKTGAAALRKQGISPRTNKPVRKYTKSGLKAGETGTVKAESAAKAVASTKVPKAPAKKAVKKVVKEVVASDE